MLYPIVLNPASVDTSKVEEVIDVLDPNDTRFLLRVGWREYLRQYNSSMLTVRDKMSIYVTTFFHIRVDHLREKLQHTKLSTGRTLIIG
jgi:hypothetical protein